MQTIAIILSVAFAQWVICLVVSRKKVVLASSAVLAVAWILFAASASEKPMVAQASVVAASGSTGSCALLERGMTAADARARVGTPDEVRNEETIRGPKAEAWVFRGSRCAVHLVGDKVEFIE